MISSDRVVLASPELRKAPLGSDNLNTDPRTQTKQHTLNPEDSGLDIGVHFNPSIEEKAAHLLYFIVKNHSFVDGNKRIAAALFTWFLERNHLLYKADGTKRIADNALVALALMIAMSDPKDKDVIIKVIINLINKNN